MRVFVFIENLLSSSGGRWLLGVTARRRCEDGRKATTISSSHRAGAVTNGSKPELAGDPMGGAPAPAPWTQGSERRRDMKIRTAIKAGTFAK
jgi:hypothetical protein